MDNAHFYQTLAAILIVIAISFNTAHAQVYYDDWPVTRESNERTEIDSGGISPNFVPIGTTWNRNILTYFFENGTGDITGEQQAFRDALALWSAQTNLRFLEVCNAAAADISVRWGAFAHGDPNPPCTAGACDFDGQNGVLAHALGGPPPNQFGNNAGDIHFDESENWTLNLRGNANQPIDLITVAAHEIGHSLGLDHTTVAGSLMLANYTGSHRFLGSDDIAGIRSLYQAPRVDGIIAGPFVVCTSPNQTFSIATPPGVTGITWSRSSNLQYVSGQGTNSYTVRATGTSGLGWVEVTLQTACGNTLTVRRDVQSGVFTTGQVTVSGTAGVCPGNAYNYTANVPGGHAAGYTYTWSFPSGWSVFSQSTNTIRLYVPANNPQYGTVRVSVNNGCGATPLTGITVFPGFSCGSLALGEFIIYPNPADGELNIEKVSNQPGEAQTENSTGDESAFSVKLYNSTQKIVAEGSSKKAKLKFDTSKLTSGTYILHIYDKGDVLKEQILIE